MDSEEKLYLMELVEDDLESLKGLLRIINGEDYEFACKKIQVAEKSLKFIKNLPDI